MLKKFTSILGLSLFILSAPTTAGVQGGKMDSVFHYFIGANFAYAQDLTNPQRNAVRSAELYLSMQGFSREGLIEQLSSPFGDDYERADAVAAVDSLSIDWNAQAARSAELYLSMMGFSCRGLIEQLSSSFGDSYTEEQARYGAEQAGAC